MPNKPAKPSRPDADSPKPTPFDVQADARARADAKARAGEAALLANPAFLASVHGHEQFRAAQHAAAEASAPYRAELARLTVEHPGGFAPNSETSRRFADLHGDRDTPRGAIQDVELEAFARHGFTEAIEPKPDRLFNPLGTVPAIHADLEPLFRAVVAVSASSEAVAHCYDDLLALKESSGLPKAEEWPDSPAYERNRAQHAEWINAERDACAKRGESVAIADFLEPRWTELMREWSGYYRDWCDAIAKAKDAALSPAVAAIMDAGEARPTHRWTTQTIIDLDNLAGALHPTGMGGFDGLGFIRCGLPPLPKACRTRAEAVRERIAVLRSIHVSAVTPPTAMPTMDDYKPIGWFKDRYKGNADIAARLRRAAEKKRPTKRVATKKRDGVENYSVNDVFQHWPHDFNT